MNTTKYIEMTHLEALIEKVINHNNVIDNVPGEEFSHGNFAEILEFEGDFYVFDTSMDYANNGNMYDGGYPPCIEGFFGVYKTLFVAQGEADRYFRRMEIIDEL
jgi:hypothetical protein